MEDITVTVASSDPKKATAVIRVEVNSGAPRIANINVIAAENQSLSNARMPDIDFEKLLAAVLPSTSATPAIHTADVSAPAIDVATPAADSTAPDDSIEHPVTPAATGRRARVARTTGVKSTPATATPPKKNGAPKIRAVKKSPAVPAPRSSNRKTAPAPATAGTKRRLMPDDFVDVYHQAPHRAAIADHFGVKDHTAQSWINTARKRGLIPPARSRG